MRALVDSDSIVTSPIFTGADETAKSIDGAAMPSIVVTDYAGAAMPSPVVTAVDGAAGLYRVTLSSDTHAAELDRLTLVWSGEVDGLDRRLVQVVEIVGGFYASTASIRAMPNLDNVTKYPTARLVDVRTEFEDLVDEYRGVSFVPRLAVEPTVSAWSWRALLLDRPFPRALRSITVDDAPIALDGIGLRAAGFADSVATVPAGRVVVAYEHGLDAPPAALERACREYVRAVLVRELSGVDRDIISQSVEGMTTRYSTPDAIARRPTGYVEVDRLLNELPDHRVPV